MAHTHSRSCCSSSGAGKRIFGILAVGAIAAVAVSLFTSSTSRPRVQPAPAPAKMASMKPRDLQAHASDNGIVAGAAAAQNALAAVNETKGSKVNPTVQVSVQTPVAAARMEPLEPREPLEPSPSSAKPNPTIKFSVSSPNPEASREKAINEALLVAQKRIAEHLRSLDEPIDQLLDLETIRSQFLRSDTVAVKEVTDPELIRKWDEAKVESKRMYAQIDIEVSEDQIRKLRAGHRLESAGWVAALAFAAIVALFGFLRVDAWTKGYLTTGLAIAFAGAVGAAVVLFFWAR